MAKRGPVKHSSPESETVTIDRGYYSGPSTIGKTIVYIPCPFCKREITAYLWSLCGGGKRCNPDCGALHSAYGSKQWKDLVTP